MTPEQFKQFTERQDELILKAVGIAIIITYF